MIIPKKILLPLFLIIVLITFSILLKIVIAGYKPPFGGEYTNLCGTGRAATSYGSDIPGQCVARCNIETGRCTITSSQWWMYVFVCDGWHLECNVNRVFKMQGPVTRAVYEFAAPGTNKTVQMDIFDTECDPKDKWDNPRCLDGGPGIPPSALRGYMVWYTGQPSQSSPPLS
jgi:hypothetical protein